MENNFNHEKLIWLAGIEDDDDEDIIYKKLAYFFTTYLNVHPSFKMDGFKWECSYIDGGKKVKFDKVGSDGLISYLIVDYDTLEYERADVEDSDIKKLLTSIVLSMFF